MYVFAVYIGPQVSNFISLVIAFLVSLGCHIVFNVLLSCMAFDPRDIERIGSFCFECEVEMLSQITIADQLPFPRFVNAFPKITQHLKSSFDKRIAVRGKVYRPMCTHCYYGSSKLCARTTSSKSSYRGVQRKAIALLLIVAKHIFCIAER